MTHSGIIRDGTLDYSSDYFLADPSESLLAWVVTDDGETIYVYHVGDMRDDNPVWVEHVTFTPGAGYNGKVRIISSREETDFVLVTWKDQTGVYMSRSTASSPSFGAAAAVGATVADTDHDEAEHGAAVYDEFQVIIAPDGSIGGDGKVQYFPYYATSKTGSFSKASSVPTDERSILGFAMARHSPTAAVVAMELPEAPTPPTLLSTVTFDGGGYPYTIISGSGTGTIGLTPPAAFNAVNLAGIGLSNGLIIEVDFGADYVFTGVEFVAGADALGGLTGERFFTRIQCFDPDDTIVVNYEIETLNGFQQSFTAEQIGLTVPIRKIHLWLILTWESDSGSGTQNVYMDNIDVTAILIERDTQRKLYQLIQPGTWAEITPSEPYVPDTPYGMAFDHAQPDRYSMIGTDERGYRMQYRTTTAGASWSKVGRTAYKGLKRGGDTLILFGYNSIGLSPDIGTTVYERIGNWPVAVAPVDEIRWVAGVL